MNALAPIHDTLVADLRQLIADARLRAAAAVNAELTGLYWQVRQRIHREILGSQRANYGEEIVSALARQLTAEHGRGFSAKNLRHMVRLAQVFPDEAIVSALRRQLSWTHLKALIYVDDPLKRDFYIELCRLEGWSSRQLHERMQSLLYERSALSRKPQETIRHDLALRQEQRPSPAVLLKDPYQLDFLGLHEHCGGEEAHQSARAGAQGQQTRGAAGHHLSGRRAGGSRYGLRPSRLPPGTHHCIEEVNQQGIDLYLSTTGRPPSGLRPLVNIQSAQVVKIRPAPTVIGR